MSQETKPTIVVSDVLNMLDEGKTREEIREFYGISKADLTRLFKNPNLKNKKPRKKPGFILEDDISTKDENPGPERAEAQTGTVSPVQEEPQSSFGEGDFRNPSSEGTHTSDDASSEQGDMDGIPVR